MTIILTTTQHMPVPNANANGTKSFNVTIPKGSANPQVDITS